MNARQLNQMLVQQFSGLKQELNQYVSWQDGYDTGAFLTYEDVFRPHIEEALKTGDSAFLQKAADFLEQLYLSGDDYAMNVVNVGVLEGLKDNCDNAAVKAILKPTTKAAFNEIAY